MIVFGLLSFAVVALVFYYFRTYTVKKLLPEDFIEQLVGYVKAGKTDDAVKLCEKNSNLVADVALAALARKWEGRDVVEQAIKDQGRRSISFLWQQLSYLVDIATIAPMVGLLGTVVGMIEAFNGIAFEMTAVKPILLASGIAKAMIATAAGLFIAIPAMIFYAYFKGKLQKITLEHEHVATELLYLITEREGK
jgi:biopolymer transport protein ExbB